MGGSYCKLTPYGATLQANKRNVGDAIDRVLANYPNDKKQSYKALMLAVAMQVSILMHLTLWWCVVLCEHKLLHCQWSTKYLE